MKNINKERFKEVHKEIARCFLEIEQMMEYYEVERDDWMRRYYAKVKENQAMKQTMKFCIKNMRNEFECTDKRTQEELKSMVEMLEELL